MGNNPADDIPESVRFLHTITAAGHRWRAHQQKVAGAAAVQQSPRFGLNLNVTPTVPPVTTVSSDEARSWRKGSMEAKKEGKDEEVTTTSTGKSDIVDLPKIQTLETVVSEEVPEQKDEEVTNGAKMLSAEEVETQ